MWGGIKTDCASPSMSGHRRRVELPPPWMNLSLSESCPLKSKISSLNCKWTFFFGGNFSVSPTFPVCHLPHAPALSQAHSSPCYSPVRLPSLRKLTDGCPELARVGPGFVSEIAEVISLTSLHCVLEQFCARLLVLGESVCLQKKSCGGVFFGDTADETCTLGASL